MKKHVEKDSVSITSINYIAGYKMALHHATSTREKHRMLDMFRFFPKKEAKEIILLLKANYELLLKLKKDEET